MGSNRTVFREPEGFLKAAPSAFSYSLKMPEDTRSGSGTQGHQQADTEAQQHPEGNVPDRVESPEVGLPVDDGQPSGEENGEQQQD